MAELRIRVPITKVDAVNRLVYGVAALQQQDKTGETFHYESSKPFFKSWSEEIEASTKMAGTKISYGNVREMHGKAAAGRLDQPIEFNDDDLQMEVCAKVVDNDAWNKVEEGVYTGFSIGGDYEKRWTEGGVKYYTARPSEISLVDNPAMPGAHFSMIKADGFEESRTFAAYEAPEENEIVAIPNELVVKRAQEMAKAAGASGFADFIEEARAELEKAANPQGTQFEAVPEGAGGQMKPSGKAKITGVDGVENDHEIGEGSAADTAEAVRDVAVPKPSAPGNTGDASLRGSPNAPAQPTLGKSVDEIYEEARAAAEQVWKATDGTTYTSKADAIAHNVKLSTPVNKFASAVDNMAKSFADLKEKQGQKDKEEAKDDKKPKKADGSVEECDKATEGEAGGPAAETGAAAKAVPTGRLQKGMYSVSRLALIIEDLNWLCESVCYEAEWEKDNSGLPAELKSNISTLCTTLRTMVDEETAEMISDSMASLEMAASSTPGRMLNKWMTLVAGTKLNKDTSGDGLGKMLAVIKATMPKEHTEKLQEMHDHCCAMGAKCDNGSVGKSLQADDGRLAKGMEILSAENAELSGALEKALGLMGDMQKNIQTIMDQPIVQPPGRTHVVHKGGGVEQENPNGDVMELMKFMPPDAFSTAAIKLAQSSGGHRVVPRLGGPRT